MITLATVRRTLAAHRPTAADQPGSQLAAVALMLAPAGPDLEALFIRRAVRADDPWSGQVGLPGGRAEPRDADLLATAVRETREEVAVDLGGAERLGILDDIYPVVNIERPMSRSWLKTLLSGAYPFFYADETTEGAYFYDASRRPS